MGVRSFLDLVKNLDFFYLDKYLVESLVFALLDMEGEIRVWKVRSVGVFN